MEYTAENLIEVALGELGYLEKCSTQLLDSKTDNAGSGNFTKYARDLSQAGYYNGSKQGVAWCNVFVDWCHYMAAGKDRAEAQHVSCQSGPYGAGCRYSMGYYSAAGQFVQDTPRPGDQIYFGTPSTVDHTGLVWKVEKGTVYTIEGNTSGEAGVIHNGGGVFQKSYALTDSRILGYGRPRFGDSWGFSLVLTVTKNGETGSRVKALQQLLQGNGCGCGIWGADGRFGNATETAVRKYQKKKGLQVDGMAGPETWSALLGL